MEEITPDHLFPGVTSLFSLLDDVGIPYGIASSSKNARVVCQRLGIAHRLGVLADGYSVQRQKPHPDIFLFAAARLNVPVDQALVIEDSLAGIQGALIAGMPYLALGPEERFESLSQKDCLTRRDNLENITLAELEASVCFNR